MNAQSLSALSLLTLSLSLCLTGCRNPVLHASAKHRSRDTTATVDIQLSVGASGAVKTIVPGLAGATTSIAVTVSSGSNSQTKTVYSSGGSVSFSGLDAGEWDIAAEAYDGATRIGSGALADIALGAGSTKIVSVPIRFTGYAGYTTGDLDISLSWPTSSGASYLGWTLDGTAMAAPAVSAGANYYAARLEAPGLGTGSRAIVLTFRKGGASGTVLGTFVEVVNIVAGMRSNRWIDSSGTLADTMSFSPADFFDSRSSLAGLDLGSYLAGFSSTTYLYKFATNPTGSFTFGATRSLQGQALSYEWNGTVRSWASTSGLTSTSEPLTPSGGADTLKIYVTAPDKETKLRYLVTSGVLVNSSTNLASALSGNLNGYFILAEDIALPTWRASGGSSSDFQGTFDGDGHTITIQATTGNYASFIAGVGTSGTVTNLTVNGNLSGNYGGAIACGNRGLISHCSSGASITVTSSTGGGIAGSNSDTGRIEYSSFTGSLNGQGYYIGGIVGYATGIIYRCYVTGSVHSTSDYVGGIVGNNNFSGTTISECCFTGRVEGNVYVGGIIGSVSGGDIENCYSRGIVIGAGAAGQIAGNGNGSVSNCYGAGTVTPAGGYLFAAYSGSITNCYDADSSDTTYYSPTLKVSVPSPWSSGIWGISATVNDGYPYLRYFLENTTVYN